MPSRLGVGSIVLFWAAVTGYAVYRDVWPRLFGDAPPAIRIDLSDEATQAVPARWTVYRGDRKVGSLTTELRYLEDGGLFRFTSTYRNLEFDVGGLGLSVPEIYTWIDVTRGGALRGEGVSGILDQVHITGVPGLTALPLPRPDRKAKDGPGDKEVPLLTASVSGVVREGQLAGTCVITGKAFGTVEQPLDPVPVPDGQVLNPLQPVNRLRDVRPGHRWVLYQVDPLADALAAMVRALLKEHAGTSLANFRTRPEALIAQVSDRPEPLPPLPPGIQRLRANERARWAGEPPECWVIEYRGERAAARSWVRVGDGKVLRQEASGNGETLVLERED